MSSTPTSEPAAPLTAPTAEPRVVPWLERISYGLGDTASNLVFHMVGTYLLYFYTDVFGLPAATVATLFLVTRLLDVLYDVGVGIAIDKTRTRWGKCRPYFLWLAAPYAVCAVLTFNVPSLGVAGKLLYAYLTYNAISLCYTAINLPISAMLPSMTRNSQERSEVGATRMFFAFIGVTLVTYGTMPLVGRFGGGDQAKGFFWTMTLFAVFAFVFFLLTFANTRERYLPEKHAEPTLKESLRAMLCNWPWAITLLVNLFYWVGFAMRTQTAVFYLRYNFHRPDLIPTVMLTNLAALPSIALAALLAKAIGKRNTMICGCVVMALGVALIYVAGTASVALFMAGNIVANFGKGFFVGLLFALMADTVDFGEWKTGVRASGFLFAAATIGVKIGLGVGGALSAWMLSASGYVPNGVQPPAALAAIQANYIFVPLVIAIINIALLLCYRLDAQHAAIMRDLEERSNRSSLL